VSSTVITYDAKHQTKGHPMIADCDPNSGGPSTSTSIALRKRLESLKQALIVLDNAWRDAIAEAGFQRHIVAVQLRKMEGPLAEISYRVEEAIDQATRTKGQS
jgi:hypothetical protein